MARRTFMAAGTAAALAPGARGAPPDPIAKLKDRLAGRLVLRADPDFEGLRRVWSFNPRTDRRPLAIARCHDADEVARAIVAAREAGLELAVRAGGHDVLGAGDCEGGLVVDLRLMTGVSLDAPRRRARVGAGVISGAFNLAAGEAGLAPVLGCNPDVGVAGLTLGGGVGWLLGTHGAACDHLVGAELVTAAGEKLRVGRDAHPDLDWALRGGGGNFGVVTAFDFDLVPLREVYGGPIAFRVGTPGSLAAFLRHYREVMSHAPDALTVELSAFHLDGPAMLALVCWSGTPDAGDRALAPLRSFAKPAFDQVRVVPYAHLTDRPGDAGGPAYLSWRGLSFDRLADGAAEALEAQVRAAPPGWSLGLGHVMRGEITRPAPTATPFIRRPGQMACFIGVGWKDATVAQARMDWVDGAVAALAPWSSSHTYVNYLSDDSPAAVAAAYGENYGRLQAVKRRYDPDNLFRHNRNIRA